MSTLIVSVPVRIESLNKTYTEHWRVRANRNTSHRAAAFLALRAAAKFDPSILPCVVTLTRVAPRAIDQHDNLRAGFKSVADGVADWLGVKDNDPCVEWRYAQSRGPTKHYSALIEIRPQLRDARAVCVEGFLIEIPTQLDEG